MASIWSTAQHIEHFFLLCKSRGHHQMHRFVFVGLAMATLTGCSSPLTFGPGRVNVVLEDVQVRLIEHEAIFGKGAGGNANRPSHEVIQFAISSETDLLDYFEKWDRQIQVRCTVSGNTNGKSYSGFAMGPYSDGVNISRVDRHWGSYASRPDLNTNRFNYVVYGFFDLVAQDSEYEMGKPASRLDLRTEKFDRLSCHVLGVTMTPVLFPRTSDFVLDSREFHALRLGRGQ